MEIVLPKLLFVGKTRSFSHANISIKMKYVLLTFIVLPVFSNFSSGEDTCGCKKLKRNFGTAQMQEICYNIDFLTLIQQPPLTHKMVRIKGGIYSIGTNNPILKADGEAPMRPVDIDDYYLDRYEVSIGEFAEFVNKTGYISDAHRFGDSFILYSMLENWKERRAPAAVDVPWWLLIKGISWDHPEGPNTTIIGNY